MARVRDVQLLAKATSHDRDRLVPQRMPVAFHSLGLLPVCIDILSGGLCMAEHRVGASILVARLLCHFVAGPKGQTHLSVGRETRRTAADATSLLAER